MKESLFSKITVSLLAGALAIFGMVSCTTGLGESIDLEAPTLEITSPVHGTFQRKNVTVQGTATDNRKIYSIEVKYSYIDNGEIKTGSKYASISGSKTQVNWSCDFSFDKDYEVEFEAYAYDQLKNGSDSSHDRIMALIDSEDPGINRLSIVRGDYIARLLSLDEFTKTDGRTALKNQPQNKDYFQNEEFKIVANLRDNYGIYEALLDLYVVDPTTKAETLLRANIEPDSTDNLYYPEFTINPEKISELNKLASGTTHYIKPHLKAKDEATNSANRNTDGILAWEPEYNTPHVVFTGMDSNSGSITVQQGSPIPVMIFDDDDLKSIEYALVKSSDFTNKKPVTWTSVWGGVQTSERLRDHSFEIDTANYEDGAYYLVLKVYDKSAHSESEYYFKETPVKITNGDAPLIIVESPEENSEPNLYVNGKFKIEGKVIDNQAVNKIAIAWLPKGNNDISAMEDYFTKTYDFSSDETYSGIKIHKLNAGTASTYPTGGGGAVSKYQNSYSKEFDFFNDFKINGTFVNENKVFMIAAKDQTDNVSTKTFRMNRFSTLPGFKVEYSDDSGSNWTITENPVITHKCTKVQFRITPTTKNGMSITKFTVKDADKKETLHEKNDATAYEKTIDDPKSGQIINLELHAENKLGESSDQKLKIRFEELGTLESVTCSRNKDTVFTASETITLQANFNGKVTVSYPDDSKKPYIELSGTNFKDKNGTAVAADNRRAYYTRGTETNTLYFEYKVRDDIEATALKIATNSPIVLNGATFEGETKVTLDADKTINNSNYAIDSIAPYIVSATPTNGGVVEKENGSVDIKLTFNENVFVESGTIVMKRTSNWYIPPVLSEEVFLKIWNAATKDQRNALCGSSTSTFITGTDPNGLHKERDGAPTLIAKGPYMQYTNGLKESGGKLVPDLETKYVLAYEYNIGDTSGGVVANLRTALESVGYHKAEFEATVVKVEDKVATLKVSDSDFIGGLVNGVEYTLTISDGAFRDNAYNYYKAGTDNAVINGSNNAYKFWVGPVATPVIRVNRIATNGTSTANSPANKGKTTAKIDCETPGAAVKYGILVKTQTGDTKNSDNTTTHTKIADETKTNVDNSLTNNSTSITLNGSAELSQQIGDGLSDTCQKIYIVAQASKDGFTAATGYEGAFKTVLHYYFTHNASINGGTSKNPEGGFIVYGSQVPEGSSYTAGWPLTQNGSSRSDYQIAYKGSGNDYYWVSWQILSDYTIQTYTNQYQFPADTEGTYGSYIYAHNKFYYDNTFGNWTQAWTSYTGTY